MFADAFKQKALAALSHNHQAFYDDFHEYGNPKTAKHALYFIPGINGTPGQVRFAFPVIRRRFGTDIYIRCLFVPEFSAEQPIWEKYTLENVDKKRLKIIEDLKDLLQQFETVMVFASSNGFYDFLYATTGLADEEKQRLRLYWLSCAPDHFNDSPWFSTFYHLNGFEHNGHAWAAFPNHTALKCLNPETNTKHTWRVAGRQKKTFYKSDLESRFKHWGILWAYASISCFNACLDHIKQQADYPITIPTRILAATKDGYWQGKSEAEIRATLERFVKNPTMLFRPTSHLWITRSDHIDALLSSA